MNLGKLTRNQILEQFKIFEGGTGGLDSWLGAQTPREVFTALADLESKPLTQARLNQLFTISHEAPVSLPMYQYYWLSTPTNHPYDVKKIPCFDERWVTFDSIRSIDQLFSDLYRFYMDALLFFGQFRTAHQRLRTMGTCELDSYFSRQSFDADGMRKRGEPLSLQSIAKDNRYLISDMACKSFEAANVPDGELAKVLIELYRAHREAGGRPVTVKALLSGAYEKGQFADRQLQFDLSSDDFLEDVIENEDSLLKKIERVAHAFEGARKVALSNTELYLSMVGDLDVYVATSMRDRRDFRDMADFCDSIFSAPELRSLNIRYFDPTLSAAANHEDKGLIECLMVKCAKVLLLNAGSRDSYGKDAEAAMALSLGMPVIVYTDEESRSRFFS